MSSTTEAPVSLPRPPRPDARLVGALFLLAGLGLFWIPLPLAAALGLESVAAAFWFWARSAPDREEQLRRWGWLRRPAAALWLAAGLDLTLNAFPSGRLPVPPATYLLLGDVEALAIVWAGLELLAALPLARAFSDLPGPLVAMGPWLPAALPAAGFAVLWQLAPRWSEMPGVGSAAVPLLLVTAVLAVLRAFSRRPWTASLRWLAVADSALGALLVATLAVPAAASLLLWAGAYGGRAALLAGELRGAAPRRGPFLSGLWRLATWTASTALAFPVLLAVGFGRGGALQPAGYAAVAFPVALAAWTSVRRMVEAPERRAVMRPDPVLTLSHVAAFLTLLVGPVALALVWWSGYETSWPAWGLALLPPVAGGCVAVLAARGERLRLPGRFEAASGAARRAAGGVFRAVVAVERRLVWALDRVGRALTAPLRDLHTGDAQEYLLLLAGVSVLAVFLSLLG